MRVKTLLLLPLLMAACTSPEQSDSASTPVTASSPTEAANTSAPDAKASASDTSTSSVAEAESEPVGAAEGQHTPDELRQMIDDPDGFNPTSSKTEGSENAGTPTWVWEWGESFGPDNIKVTKLQADESAWQLDLADYPIDSLAPDRSHLAEVRDDVMGYTTTIYEIGSGPFEGEYLSERTYSDGATSLSVSTAAFAVGAANGSEYQSDTDTKLLSYPLYGVLENKAAMCQVAGVTCS